MRRLMLLAALAGACTRVVDGGVEARVDFTGFQPACLEVVAADVADPTRTGSATVRVTASRTHKVAIARGPGWSDRWSISVLAHEGSCTGAVVARAEEPNVQVPGGGVKVVTFSLNATDADGDGWVTDCDDMNALRSPGLAESCLDGLVNDCELSADCADSDCAGAPYRRGARSTRNRFQNQRRQTRRIVRGY